MKKYIISIGLIIAVLAISLPFVSTTPDGLETLVEASDAQEPSWNGLIGDYAISILDNPYLSTLAAGIIGTAIVFWQLYCLGRRFPLKGGASIKTPLTLTFNCFYSRVLSCNALLS